MQKNTPCIRCGKIRIEGKSWTEYIETSRTTYTLTVCPDPKCQKIVEEQLKRKSDDIEVLRLESLKRRENTRNKRLVGKSKKRRT